MKIDVESPVAPERVKRTDERICVIGLGYVGLPVAVAFARRFDAVTGFDLSQTRIAELRRHHDRTGEIVYHELSASTLMVSDDAADLAAATLYVVTVPTPITEAHRPDLSLLLAACRTIGPHLATDDIVVFESTVYPGATEEVCGPALEAASGLVAGRDFTLGYSPNGSIPATRRIVWRASRKWSRDRTPPPWRASPRPTAKSSRQACISRPRSRWPRPPR